MNKPEISIIMPCLNEAAYIADAIDSIVGNQINDYELIIVDGQSTDGTREIVQRYVKENTAVKMLENPKQITPCAMNIGIRAARGNVIFRVDAHSTYPPGYFELLANYLDTLEADNVGTCIETSMLVDSPKANALRSVLSDKYGVGNSLFRTGVDRVREVDTVPFGCFRRETFEKYGYYDERLAKSQDLELNKRIVRGGGKIFLVPDVKIAYYARENLSLLAKKYFDNGKWNIYVIAFTRSWSSVSLRQYIPTVFLLTILTLFFLSLFIASALIALALLIVIYGIALFIRSVAIKRDNSSIWWAIATFIALHFSHAFGAMVGLFNVLIGKKGK